ncbi:hypothetical protein EBB79_00670 [Parasedimentitalea marina]|uniref:DUF4149 domain-containing protein n=1 Tax=Parasedimentitalea marina TaxID=2483033 RepID=A0A3T0MXR5_9RHOB|nr:hypothetical protein [Parasedimentitalea marina]AZV76549.1 hypothetical protein EBB79_00670 [Parasedimentitalea marina]
MTPQEKLQTIQAIRETLPDWTSTLVGLGFLILLPSFLAKVVYPRVVPMPLLSNRLCNLVFSVFSAFILFQLFLSIGIGILLVQHLDLETGKFWEMFPAILFGFDKVHLVGIGVQAMFAALAVHGLGRIES